MITVTGFIDHVAYTAVIDAEHDTSVEHPGYVGIVSGSQNILDLLRERAGDEVAVTPTGPFSTLDVTDAHSVVAALRAWTRVVNTMGDNVPEPDLGDEDLPADAVH